MSDTSNANPQDPAIEALRERVRQFDAENAADAARIAARTLCRDEFNEMIAVLTRKLRPRKPRVVSAQGQEPSGREAPQDRQESPANPPLSVFGALPSNDDLAVSEPQAAAV
jgi:hypothetical protein